MDMDVEDVVHELQFELGGGLLAQHEDMAVDSLEDKRAFQTLQMPLIVHEPALNPCVSAEFEPLLPAMYPLQLFSVSCYM